MVVSQPAASVMVTVQSPGQRGPTLAVPCPGTVPGPQTKVGVPVPPLTVRLMDPSQLVAQCTSCTVASTCS